MVTAEPHDNTPRQVTGSAARNDRSQPRAAVRRPAGRTGSVMPAVHPTGIAHSPVARFVLGTTRVNRVLDGGWWPRSWDAEAELPGLVQALSERYGRIRHVLLNGPTWTGHVRRLSNADGVVRVGWFASMSAALMVAITDADDHIDLLVVPPSFDHAVAEQAMTKAADPANVAHAAELLEAYATQPAHASRSVHAIQTANKTGFLEAVWDDEGGSTAPASSRT
jgi:Family of unknown function (DUF5994)